MGISKHEDDAIVLKGRVFKIKVDHMPPTLPFPNHAMYDLRYKKEDEHVLFIYITCNVGIIDDTQIQDFFNDIINKPPFKGNITDILSCSYHEEYTWLSNEDYSSNDDNSSSQIIEEYSCT